MRISRLGAKPALWCAVLGVAMAGGAQASLIVSPADYTGSRTTPPASGVVGGGNYASNFKISWMISQVGPNWSYTYKLTRLNDSVITGPGISHLLLETSQNFTLDDISNVTVNGNTTTKVELKDWTSQQGNPNLPGTLHGIKIDVGGTTYSFLSTRAPIWGDFYTKGGSSSTAWNTGIGTDPTGSPFTNWVPTPDTVTAVPEPSTVGLAVVGVGTGALGAWKRRRRVRA